MVLLLERKHWTTVNRFITTRLGKEVYPYIASFFPDDEAGFEALDPKILLQQIEQRLVTMDQAKQKRLRFKLAKQTLEENPWNYKNRLQMYYKEAHIQDKTEFMEVFRRGVYNKELRKLLMLHNPQITSIECLKTVVQHYQTQLLIYAEISPDIEPSAIAGLGAMQYGLTGRKQETIRQIQEL